MGNFIIKCKAKEIQTKLVEQLRQRMNESIIKNGLGAAITIKLSQELDKLIVREQLKKVSL